jgi:hypothetical protein
MINENFAILGAVISFFGGIPYLVGTIRGKVRPNKVTWFLWALAPLIAFAAEIKQGIGLQAWMTFAIGFSPLLIFIASFLSKNAYWKLTRFDLACGFFSVAGLILWYFSKNPNVAIFFAILSDALAATPTVIKSFKYPETENALAFLATVIGVVFTLLTIKTWNFAYASFPLYIFVADSLIFFLIQFKIGKKFIKNEADN